MMIKQFEKLEESIADKIKDYQKDLNHWTFDDIWQIEDIMGADPEKYISHIQFLNIQRKGKSQKRLLRLIEEYYLREKHTQINKINHAGLKNIFTWMTACIPVLHF